MCREIQDNVLTHPIPLLLKQQIHMGRCRNTPENKGHEALESESEKGREGDIERENTAGTSLWPAGISKAVWWEYPLSLLRVYLLRMHPQMIAWGLFVLFLSSFLLRFPCVLKCEGSEMLQNGDANPSARSLSLLRMLLYHLQDVIYVFWCSHR